MKFDESKFKKCSAAQVVQTTTTVQQLQYLRDSRNKNRLNFQLQGQPDDLWIDKNDINDLQSSNEN